MLQMMRPGCTEHACLQFVTYCHCSLQHSCALVHHCPQVIGPSTSTPTKPSASRIPRPPDHTSFGGKIRLLSSAPSLSQPSAVVSSTESHQPQQSQARQQQRQPQAFRAKLQLVDLAGSECVGMSGATGNALRETQCINKRCARV